MCLLSRRFWIVPTIAVGMLAIFLASMIKSGPEKAVFQERAVNVRAIKVPKLDVTPRVIGYGTVEAGQIWNAVAEVAGPVVWVSPLLKNGTIVPAGTELLRIDGAGYRLNLAQIEAHIQASLVKDKATSASLAIAERNLKLLAEDYKRKKSLAAKGTVSAAGLEAAERQVLNGETQMQNLRNTLAINQAEREVLKSQLGLAELDLQHILITAPFDVRITDIFVDLAQYANKGQLLFQGDGIATADVKAQFPIGSLRSLIMGRKQQLARQSGLAVQGALGLDAVIRLKTGTHTPEWQAKVSRVAGTIDARTQSVGIVTSIKDPYQQAEPGKRPPLVRGTFVEMELRGSSLRGQVVVPIQALHEGKVYLVNEENRLVIRLIKVKFAQGGFAVIAKGLKPGSQLVVTDLVPAVEGMLLTPIEDKKTKMKLVAAATGVPFEKLKRKMKR